MYTIRPDKPANPVLLEILATVQAITKKLGCDYLLVGATARDMLMTHVFGLDARRATHDVDFAIALESWDQFQALKSAIDVDTGNGLVIRVVSIPALAALKLLAWNDRGLRDNKDAQDLLFLLQHYHEAGNSDRMYEDGYGLLEAAGFDLPAAGAALLGHDTGMTLHDDSLHALLAILTDPRKRDRLIVHMTRSAGVEAMTADKLLSQFEHGLQIKSL